MDEQLKQKEILFNKAISFFNENLYSMALYYFVPSKNITNEEIVDDYIKKCNERIKERNNSNTSRHYLNPNERLEEERTINRILQSSDYHEILGLKNNASKDQIIEAYKKLIIKFHPDVSTSSKSEELFKKITKSYNKLINHSNNDINPYELFFKVFKDDDSNDIVELLNKEKSDLELKQFNIPPAIKYIGLIVRYGIFLYIFLYFVLPYFYSETKAAELYGFTQTTSNPYEKISKRFKVKYFIGNDFKEKYATHSDVRKVEKEIEGKYLEYLNKTCEETKEAKEKLKKRLIYYKRGTMNYDLIMEDISKVDLSICNVSERYSKKYNTYIQKLEEEKQKENEEEKEKENEKEVEKESDEL